MPPAGRRLIVGQPVDRPQERGQRLARAGRRRDQDVLARGDRRPGLSLRRRRLGECALKPVAGGGTEAAERHRRSSLARGPPGPASLRGRHEGDRLAQSGGRAQRGDPAPRLHGIAHRPELRSESLGQRVEVLDDHHHAPEAGRPVRRILRLDQLEDRRPEAAKTLPSTRRPRGSGAAASRPAPGRRRCARTRASSTTTWSIPVARLAWRTSGRGAAGPPGPAGAAGAAGVVASPSMSAIGARWRIDHAAIPCPGPPRRKLSAPTGQTPSLTVNPSASQRSGGSAMLSPASSGAPKSATPPPDSSQPGELPGPREHAVEHRLGQPPGEGVLLAGVVAPQ